jgi:hypothetical protein
LLILAGKIVSVATPPWSVVVVAATTFSTDEHRVILGRFDRESS